MKWTYLLLSVSGEHCTTSTLEPSLAPSAQSNLRKIYMHYNFCEGDITPGGGPLQYVLNFYKLCADEPKTSVFTIIGPGAQPAPLDILKVIDSP